MSDELDSLVDAFVAKLAELGYSPNPGASPVVLDYLESKNGWKFPDAMRRYLLKANGCAAGMHASPISSEGIWHFPPVESWLHAYTFDAHPGLVSRGYVGFSDALIVAPTYGICLRTDSPEWGRVALFDGYMHHGSPCGIASFEVFVAAWIAAPGDNLFDCMISGDFPGA